jgi:hypothetical protein
MLLPFFKGCGFLQFMKYLMSLRKNIEALETYIAFLVSKKEEGKSSGNYDSSASKSSSISHKYNKYDENDPI